jgi:hypothetical protein
MNTEIKKKAKQCIPLTAYSQITPCVACLTRDNRQQQPTRTAFAENLKPVRLICRVKYGHDPRTLPARSWFNYELACMGV